MKKIAFLALPLLFLACGSDNSSQEGWATDDMLVEPSEFAAGQKVYSATCIACHQENGDGLIGAFPPLANSDYLMEDIDRAIEIAANGMEGEIVVNGETYNSVMAPQGLSDEEIRDVVNYVLNSWGNDGGEVTLEDVKRVLAQ